MRVAEANESAFAPGVWTLCLALLFLAMPFSQAQTSAPADKNNVADGGGISSSKTTSTADDDTRSALGSSISSGAKTSASALEQSDASQSSSRSFFQDVVRHPPKTTEDKFHWGPALLQATNMTLFAHAWRAAWDPSLRYDLAHKPFFHDWSASYSGYNMSRWNDGDDFMVNDVGHPLGGAALGRVYLQNDDASWVQISKTRQYWGSRLKALAWMAVWSTQFEIGPLSETAFGNQGGWTYVNRCGTALSCLEHPEYGPPTNNTGWTDFIMTPAVGLLWILGEDAADRYIVTPIARRHHILGRGILGTALEPSRSFASMFAGHAPWHLPAPENHFTYNAKPRPKREDPNRAPLKRYELGAGYTNVSLPVVKSECGVCRQNNSGFGSIFTFNFNRVIGLDNSVSLLPAQGGSRGMVEGLFGIRVGERFKHWGIFGKVRPGFIYYQEAMPGLGGDQSTSLTRFAWDFGGIVEIYPNRRSSLRFDLGTTMVRYLSDHPDPRMSQLGDLRSNQYYVNQGNFQIATSYAYRF